MSIRRKNNGKYEVRVYVGYDNRKKKRVYKYKTVAGKREAQLIEAQLLTAVDNGEIVTEDKQVNKAEPYTFDEAFKEWWQFYINQDITQTTKDVVAGYFKRYILTKELFGGLYLDDINRKDIQDKVNKFLPKYVTSKTMLQYASQVFKYAVDSEHIICDSNPLEHIRMVKPKKSTKRDVRFYNEHQAKLFEMGIREYWSTSNQMPALFTVLLRTGARIGEVVALKWNDVNFKDMTLRFDAHIYSSSSKANAYYEGLKNHDKSRVLDVDTVLLGMLKSWKLEQSKLSLLKGKPINEDSFIFSLNIATVRMANERFIKWYNKNHDEYLPCLNLHGFRHTHATLLISDGMDLKKVADRLGHKDITITANIYAEVTPKAKKEVAERFSKILGN